MQQNERKASRTRSPRRRSPSGRMYRRPCKDYDKGTCNNSFCEKWHPPKCWFYKTKSGCRFGEKCSCVHRQVYEQPSKRSKKNDDKSAVAMLKKNDWHENVRQLVVNHGKSHNRSGRPDKNRDHELKRGTTGRRSSNSRQLGCVFQDMKPPKSNWVMSRWPCKDYLKGTCNNSSCKRWHPPECLFYKNKNGCRFGEKCSFAHRQVDTQPTKWSKSNNDKSAVTLLKKG